MYPEYYRKSNEFIKGSNLDAPEPLRIGSFVFSTFCRSKNMYCSNTSTETVNCCDILCVLDLLYVSLALLWHEIVEKYWE